METEESREIMSERTEAQKESRSGKIGKKAVSKEKEPGKKKLFFFTTAIHSIMQSCTALTPPQSAALMITTELNHSIIKMEHYRLFAMHYFTLRRSMYDGQL